MRRPLSVLSLILGLTACGGGSGGGGGAAPSDNSAIEFPAAGGDSTFTNRTSGAFTFPAPNLSDADLANHVLGDALFDQTYVATPGQLNSGLGPVFNNVGCRSCHIKNGRGMPVMGDDGALRSHVLTRISIDPTFAANFPGSVPSPGEGPFTVPGLGTQLQDYGVFGQDAEAKVKLTFTETAGTYPDGTSYTLRQPAILITGVNATLLNSPGVLHSLRQTPPVFGLGLLEAVSDETLLALEDPEDKNKDGISGRLNRVWNPETGTVTIGRFGWKASAPSILSQTAAAFAEDLGVTSPLHLEVDGSSDITMATLTHTAFYTQTLAVPARNVSSDPKVNQGAELFRNIGCESCHVRRLISGNSHPIESLRNQSFSPFTDLLLHDMGEGLSDHRPDFQATGSEWRTAPLWGIGLTQTVLPGSGFLHDGRARTIEEAILWHGGEASKSQDAFRNLSLDQRTALLNFLKTL
ncbi:MAG: thiol oxidoreductase [Proteobacteria bacterium]|nr:MAG: thiol oxidoreductase [Pseudomonadota bacterium]